MIEGAATMTMTSEAKHALAATIRSLRTRLLADLHDATESALRIDDRIALMQGLGGSRGHPVVHALQSGVFLNSD